MPARPATTNSPHNLAEEYELQERTRRQNARMTPSCEASHPPQATPPATSPSSPTTMASRPTSTPRSVAPPAAPTRPARTRSRSNATTQRPRHDRAAPRVQPAVDAYNALIVEQTHARSEVGAAKRALPAAREADKRAWATALAADTKSKDPRRDKAQRAIHHAERRVPHSTSRWPTPRQPSTPRSPRTEATSLPRSERGSPTASTPLTTRSTHSIPTSPRTQPRRPPANWLRNFPDCSNSIAKGVCVPALALRQRNTGHTAASTRDVIEALRELLKSPEPRGTRWPSPGPTPRSSACSRRSSRVRPDGGP